MPDSFPPCPTTQGLPVKDLDMAAEPTKSTEADDSYANTMIRQVPESHPVTLESLVKEVNGIYAGLSMVESKCTEVDNNLAAILTNDQWAALVSLHRTLIHEHHDFLLASQHPRASPALQDLPNQYAMPARLWRHGIHAFLEVIRHRLPGSLEVMLTVVYMSYAMMSLLEETVPRFRRTWIECKGDLARYRIGIEHDDLQLRQQWTKTSAELYSRAIDHDPLVGRLYHHVAILNQSEGAVAQFFYYIKALVVKEAFLTARHSIFILTDPIVQKGHADPFLVAVSHLVMASQSPEIRREKGHDTEYDHRQSCCRALKELLSGAGVISEDEARLLASLEVYMLFQSPEAVSPSQTVCDDTNQPTGKSEDSTLAPSEKTDQPAQASTLRPSHKLGVLICMLLLGIPQSDKVQSTMMAAWAPDYVKSADRADLAAGAARTDIYENAKLAALLAAVTITHILKRADTTDVQLWEFIHVILVFMRAMMTRPDMYERFGWAFPAQLLAPFLNMALRDAESRGRDWISLSQPEFPTSSSPLNRVEKPGVYGRTAISRCHALDREKEMIQQTTFTTPLPEDKALRGLFFARQIGRRTGPQVNPKPSVPGEAVRAITGDQEQTEPSEEYKAMKCEEAQLAEEEEKKEIEEARRQERLTEEARLQHLEDEEAESRDPNFFPCRWFDESKYDFEEESIRNGAVQDEGTCVYRVDRVLWTASQLMQRPDGNAGFFTLETDKEKSLHIVVPGVPSLPQTSPDAKMPEVVELDGGDRVVFVDPCLRKTEEGDAAAVVDDPKSSYELQLLKANARHEEANATRVLQHQAKRDHDDSKAADNGLSSKDETEAENTKIESYKEEMISLVDDDDGEDRGRENRSEADKEEDTHREIVLFGKRPQDTTATITGSVDQGAVTEQLASLNEDVLEKVPPKEEKDDAENHGTALAETVGEGEGERDWVFVGSDNGFE